MLSNDYECEKTLIGKISCILSIVFLVGAITILAITVFLQREEADMAVDMSLALMMIALGVFTPVCILDCRKKEKVRYIPY